MCFYVQYMWWITLKHIEDAERKLKILSALAGKAGSGAQCIQMFSQLYTEEYREISRQM